MATSLSSSIFCSNKILSTVIVVPPRCLYTMFRRHEQMKRRAYGQRVRDIEMSSFTPLVFSAIRSWRLWPCRFDYFQANRAAPGIYLAHALLGNHGLVEMSGQFRTLALCCYVSSRIASAEDSVARCWQSPKANFNLTSSRGCCVPPKKTQHPLHHRTVHHRTTRLFLSCFFHVYTSIPVFFFTQDFSRSYVQSSDN